MKNIWTGLLPKEETQALSFISNNPTWDGRGVIVGILDTGVDPGAIGLSTTTDGKPKVIDIIDCSGSGDVLMGSPVKASQDGIIIGFGGRKIKINSNWSSSSGEYRLGVKRAYDFYPKELKDRLKQTTKEDQEKEFRLAEGKLQKLVSDAKQGESLDDAKLRIQLLKAYEKEYEDPGPVFDCIVFHDGVRWQAAVDTTETGDFTSAVLMTDYRVNRQYSTFSKLDNLNYGVNIYDEGTILSIVVDSTPHGTHVAGIVAANYPDEPECNGVAPGAQIISLKIGDSRLGSMETGVGLMRGLIEAVKRGCHIVNMSYGEATAWCNTGAFTKLTDDFVKKHGILFVASAGNNGPGISTVGCPGGTTSSCIGVGAFVTHSLMSTAYSMLEDVPETNYNWSSMGPTLDGEIGVSIMAPGAAITCVSKWTLNKKQLMNGTSMSSPNACGCITLLLSAAIINGYKYTPTSIRRAVENGAKLIPQVHILGQGHGLIQVESAWKLFIEDLKYPYQDINYLIKSSHPNFCNGVYLRQPHESSAANTYQFLIEPEFPGNAPVDMKCEFERRLSLESSASWILAPKNVLLVMSGKQISIHVDPRNLPIGIHVEFISVYDVTRSKLFGPLFKIPVTVIRPEVMKEGTTIYDMGTLTLDISDRLRKFIVPPRGCTYIDARIVDPRSSSRSDPSAIANANDVEIVDRAENPDQAGGSTIDSKQADDGGRMIVLHALQLFRGTPYRDNEHHVYKTLTPGSEHIVSWKVHEEVTMEMVLARTWGCIGDTSCIVTLHFRGVIPIPTLVTMSGGQRVSKVIRLFSPLTTVEVSPFAKLDKWTSILKPISSKISPLGERDILPDGRPLYQLVLEYEFDLADSYEVVCRWPGLQQILYESNFYAQFFMIFNAKKLLTGSGDAFPKPVKLSKGKHTVRLQVRHTSTTILDGLTDMPGHIERGVKNPISLQFYQTQTDAFAGNESKFNSRVIHMGSSASLFIREPTQESLPKTCVPGDVLFGGVTYIKKNSHSFGSTDRPYGYVFRYVVSDTKIVVKATPAAPVPVDPSLSPIQLLESAVKEAKIKYLKTLIGSTETFPSVYTLINDEYKDDLQVKQAYMNHLDKLATNSAIEKNRLKLENDVLNYISKSEEITALNLSFQTYKDLISATDALISLIDKDAIALELGKNLDKSDVVGMVYRKDIESKKTILCDGYNTKAVSYLSIIDILKRLAYLQSLSMDSVSNSVTQEAGDTILSNVAEFNSTYKELQKWDDTNIEKYCVIQIGRHLINGFTGMALKRITDVIATSEMKLVATTRDYLYIERNKCWEEMNMSLAIEITRKWKVLASRDAFEPF